MQKSRKARLTTVSAVALVIMGTLAACSPSTTTGAGPSGAACSVKGLTVAFPGPLKSNPTLQVMAAGFTAKAKELGMVPQVMLANDADPQAVLSLGKQAIAQGVSGLVFPPYDPSLVSFVDDAVAAKIPLVFTHSDVPEGKVKGALANFHPNPKQYGAAIADTIGKAIGGKGTVAITESSFNQVENDAAAAFAAEMAKSYPAVKVLDPQEEGFDPAKAISKGVSILQANPDVVAAYSTTGGGAVTWSGAAEQSGRKIAIAGMDYTRPNLDLLRNGKITALVAQPIYEEFGAAVQAIADHICGKKGTYSNPLPSEIVTTDNLQKYYDLLKKNGL